MTVLEAVRNRVLWLVAVIACGGIGLAQFLNQVAITESIQIQTALLAALMRVAAVFIVATFVVTSMVREANDKVADLLLAQPVPRSSYFLGKFAGYAGTSLVLAVAFALPLFMFAPAISVLIWMGSLMLELLIVTSVSLFCVITLTQVLSAFAATAAFYLLSRSMAAMQMIAGAALTDNPSFADAAINRIVNGIAILLPSLDRMSMTDWLIAPPPGIGDILQMAGQSLVYVALIVAAAMFDLYRRNY